METETIRNEIINLYVEVNKKPYGDERVKLAGEAYQLIKDYLTMLNITQFSKEADILTNDLTRKAGTIYKAYLKKHYNSIIDSAEPTEHLHRLTDDFINKVDLWLGKKALTKLLIACGIMKGANEKYQLTYYTDKKISSLTVDMKNFYYPEYRRYYWLSDNDAPQLQSNL
jgi:hypothetical protein